MADPAHRFTVVEDEPERGLQEKDRAVGMVLLALKALSQRTIVALESLFTLITVGLVFWASLAILQQPNTHQLIGLGIFSVFVLVANWLVLRRRG